MAAKYDFKLYNPNPQDLAGWVPVMWAKKNITMTFTAPAYWQAVDFKVFQVYPPDTTDMPFGQPNAAKVKEYIIARDSNGQSPVNYYLWDPAGDRYSHNGDPTFSEDNKEDNELTIEDKHNRGKQNGKNPVYDFILHFLNSDGKHVLVDPRIRNEY